MERRSGIKLLLFLNFGLVILDRFSKWLVLNSPVSYQNNLIELKLFKNPKLYFISFNSTLLYFLIGAVIMLLCFLFFKRWRKENFPLMIGSSLVILGGLSNFFDRIYFGYVIDWIRVFFLPISIFNVADIMIIGGIACLIFHLLKS